MIKKFILKKLPILLIFSLINFAFLSKENNQKEKFEDELDLSLKNLIEKSTLEEIKKKAKNWESYDYHENPFKDFNISHLKHLMGLKNLIFDEKNIMDLVDDDDHSLEDKLPKAFDSREEWPECSRIPRNQLHCGSCWAFSASSVLSDRFCIKSKGKLSVELSPQDMVSCDTSDYGCQGGLLQKAWSYLENKGIVEEKCFPYKSGDNEENIPCPKNKKCLAEKFGNSLNKNYEYKKFKAIKDSSKGFVCPTQIKKEILKRGPIQTGFTVYEDFMHYKSGIYEYTHGKELGGHAVKIIGWGEENGINYWIVQNSWGENWGENGFFKIKFGECMIDRNGYAGEADLDNYYNTNEDNDFNYEGMKGFLWEGNEILE